MKLLLDTHAFLWINEASDRLSQTVIDLCNAGEHEFYLSIASPWEMQIKSQLGKLSLALPIEELIETNRQKNNIQLLPVEIIHISYLQQLPTHHKDPFDRIIIAQAIIEKLTVVTADHAFCDYAVTTIW